MVHAQRRALPGARCAGRKSPRTLGMGVGRMTRIGPQLCIFALSLTCGLVAQETPAQDLRSLQDAMRRLAADQTRLAQENESLRQELGRMWGAQSELQSANQRLEEDLNTAEKERTLEGHINSLSHRYATTVESKANPISLSGEFRFRTVWATVQPTGGEEFDGYWTDSLARLGFGYQFTDHVRAFAQLQSHWAFGDGSAPSGGSQFGPLEFGATSTDVDLHQAWVEIGHLFGAPEFSMKVGRQEVVLGNQFQFGNSEWYSGWTFDGYRVEWDSENFRLTGLGLKLGSNDADVNQLHTALSPHDDDELYALYFTLKSIKDHTLDLYWIYMNGHGGATGGSGTSTGSLGTPVGGAGFAFGDTAYFHTVGARFAGKCDVADGLDYNLEAAFQFGDANGTGRDDVQGFSLEAELGLTLSAKDAFRVYGRFLFAEGPDDDQSGYVPLFPNRHANSGFLGRYGLLDALPMFNVLSAQLGFYFKPDPSWLVGATAVWSTSDERIVSTGDDDWGWEFDLWAAYVHSENLVFIFAGFVVLPEDQLQGLVGIDDDTIIGLVFQTRLTF